MREDATHQNLAGLSLCSPCKECSCRSNSLDPDPLVHLPTRGGGSITATPPTLLVQPRSSRLLLSRSFFSLLVAEEKPPPPPRLRRMSKSPLWCKEMFPS